MLPSAKLCTCPHVRLTGWFLRIKARRAARIRTESFLKPPLLYSPSSFCSNDTTHTEQASNSCKKLPLYNEQPEQCDHKLIFFHYRAYYKATADGAGAFEDICKQSEHNACGICRLIKVSAQPLAPLDIKQQFVGEASVRVSWLTISTVPLPVTSNYPWLRYPCSFPLFLLFPPTVLGL